MNSKKLTLGVIGTSNKENEKRVPISPIDMPKIPKTLRERIFVENGYGKRFNMSDEKIKELFAGMKTRKELFNDCDIILLPKPTNEDFPMFKEGQVLWGWPHCVQGKSITQLAIDKKLTYIAWEAMFTWKNEIKGLHTFHTNNEMAGYASVVHAFQLAGITGHYGRPRKAAILSFGSAGRGAVHALKGMGLKDIVVYSRRSNWQVQAPIPGTHRKQYKDAGEGNVVAVSEIGEEVPMEEELVKYDVIVNAILQDTDNPLMFIRNKDLEEFKPGTLIVDVSCDEGMGFEFAKSTSFAKPSFEVGNGVIYYAVDHSPTYFWRSASEEISTVIISFIETVMGGKKEWMKNETVRRSIEIMDGIVKNPKILNFQNRSERYPHGKL